MNVDRSGPEITINVLNPHHDYRVRQVENMDSQMKSLTKRRAQLVKEITEKPYDSRSQ